MGKKNFITTLTKAAAIALVLGIVGGSAFQGTSYFVGQLTKSSAGESKATASTAENTDVIKTTATSATAESTDVSGVVSEVMPSIVAITTMSQEEVQSFFGQNQTYQTEGAGSGIIYSKDDSNLYIATNNHVVEGATTLTVQFSDQTTASATIRGTAATDDLAVIAVPLDKISSDTLKTIKTASVGDSTAINVGDSAIAIGNALGYGQSVTTGVISALNREVSIQDETTGVTVTNKLIQTDAAINPGNSGGALINVKGEVIGINSSKYSDTTVEGMGFAIPMDTAKPIIEDLIANGKTTTTGSPYLGIYGVDVTSDVASKYNMPQGVYVAKVVDGSGASKAGIAESDIITAVDGTAVSSMSELKSKISSYKVGDKVTVTIQKADNGKYTKQDISVTLTSQNSDSSTTDNNSQNQQNQLPQQQAPQDGNSQNGQDGSDQGSVFGQ